MILIRERLLVLPAAYYNSITCVNWNPIAITCVNWISYNANYVHVISTVYVHIMQQK